MDGIVFQDLTNEETAVICGGVKQLGCALLGGLGMAAVITGNGFGLAACLIAAYNGGCFD